MSKEIIKIIALILEHELNLKNDQVVLTNQKFNIPPDDRLYVAVELMGSRPFGVKTAYEADPITGELLEAQSVNCQEMYSVLAYSKGPTARQRHWEIAPALGSTFAQQQQEEHSFKIGYLPRMTDVSGLDGTSRLNRYRLTFVALAAYRKTKPVEYFDQFAQPTIISNP
jgi:hypothetical protein